MPPPRRQQEVLCSRNYSVFFILLYSNMFRQRANADTLPGYSVEAQLRKVGKPIAVRVSVYQVSGMSFLVRRL